MPATQRNSAPYTALVAVQNALSGGPQMADVLARNCGTCSAQRQAVGCWPGVGSTQGTALVLQAVSVTETTTLSKLG
jgi:hypothetical protein